MCPSQGGTGVVRSWAGSKAEQLSLQPVKCLRFENLYCFGSAKSLQGRGWSEKVCKLMRAA